MKKQKALAKEKGLAMELDFPKLPKSFHPLQYKNGKYVCKTNFKCVFIYSFDGLPVYKAHVSRLNWSKYFSSAKEAAIAVDKKLLESGQSPINILIKK